MSSHEINQNFSSLILAQRIRKNRTLLLSLPLPPPYSGSEKMSEIILHSRIMDAFACIHVDTSNRQDSNEIRGSFRWVNIKGTLRVTKDILMAVLKHRPALANIPISPNRLGFIKYALQVLPCLLLGTKVVSRMGASHFSRFYESQPKLYQLLVKYLIKKVACIIVRGDLQKSQFSGIYSGPLETVYVPSTGITKKAFEKDLNKLPHQSMVNVLFLGMVSGAKGAYDLVSAIPELIKKEPRFRFHFAGDLVRNENNIVFGRREEMDIEKFLHENALEKYVTLHGRVEGAQKEALFEQCDIFVFPSYSEGSPFAVVEAMEHGLPLVATRAGNLVEIFKDRKNVLFVDMGSPEQIRDAVLELSLNPDLAGKIVKNNFDLLDTTLSLKNYEDRMISIFDSLMPDHNKSLSGAFEGG